MTTTGLPDYDRVLFCCEHVINKAPKSVDFIRELPKTASGKIYKKGLRDQYWGKKGKKVARAQFSQLGKD